MQAELHDLYRQNKVYIWGTLVVTIVLETTFKLIYPYPNMVLDSYYYVLGAISHADVNPWAIGYSWFLRVFGMITHSPLALTIFQYVFLEASLLVFFLALTDVLNPSRISRSVFFVFFFCNPLLMYCANFIMADSLFISLSALWLSTLLWMQKRPNMLLLWVHACLLLMAYCVRYNAIFYPFIAILGLILSRYSLRRKLAGILVFAIPVAAFIGYTNYRIGQITGVAQFSPFGNWKIANNALYMYGHVYSKLKDPVPPRFEKLDNMVRQYFDSGGYLDNLTDYYSQFHGSTYMFMQYSPLYQYRSLVCGVDTEYANFKKMAYVGPLFRDYGTYLIMKQPVSFVRYFMYPNMIRYAFPPMECFVTLTPYKLRRDELGKWARYWFGVSTLKVDTPYLMLRYQLLNFYPVGILLLHVSFMLTLTAFSFMWKQRRIPKTELYPSILLGGFWLLDFGFEITAAATVLRYEIFALCVELSLILWMIEKINGQKPKQTNEGEVE